MLEVDFWIFDFFLRYCRFSFKMADFWPKWPFSLFLEFWCAINSKKSKMHSGQVFCNVKKYFCAIFQVKWSENEGIAIGRLFFSKFWSKHCFWYFFEKITFKSLLLLRSLTILLENLYEGTSQGCKKLDRSAFLNFCYLQHIKICENIHFHRILCYK